MLHVLVVNDKEKTPRPKQLMRTMRTKFEEIGSFVHAIRRQDIKTEDSNHNISHHFSSNSEIMATASPKLDELPTDVQLHAFGFLDVESIGQVARTCHGLRNLVFSSDACELWLNQCRSRWGEVDRDSYLIDKIDVPKALSKNEMNLPLLLSMTPKELLSKVVDKSNLKTTDMIETSQDVESGDVLIHFTGQIGQDQVHSIRSDQPLPRPQLYRSPRRRWRLPSLRKKKKENWKPFVAPYKEQDESINVTPRTVSYYEVSIVKKSEERHEQRPQSFQSLLEEQDLALEESKDCIAIGLAPESFNCNDHLPGHDFSFGYHSDNGGLYHNAGTRAKHTHQYGPGDTIGCGIDYNTGGIFFTKNSKFLGFGWNVNTKFLSTKDLYPVVGIDSKDSVSINYGHRPFQFDLSGYCQKYSQSISKRYQQ